MIDSHLWGKKPNQPENRNPHYEQFHQGSRRKREIIPISFTVEQELYSPALEVPKTLKCSIFCSQRLSELLTGTASRNICSSEVLQRSPALLCPCRCWSSNNSQGKTVTVASCKSMPKEERFPTASAWQVVLTTRLL